MASVMYNKTSRYFKNWAGGKILQGRRFGKENYDRELSKGGG
jgi:hypothetical protein